MCALIRIGIGSLIAKTISRVGQSCSASYLRSVLHVSYLMFQRLISYCKQCPPKRVVQNVYVGWQSSSARRVTIATHDNDWLQDSHADLPVCMGKHWQRCFPTLEAALSQDEAMTCARAQVQADFIQCLPGAESSAGSSVHILAAALQPHESC